MKRNLHSFTFIVGMMLVGILTITYIGWTFRSVNAADTTAEVTPEPQATTISQESAQVVEPTDVPPVEEPTEVSTDVPTAEPTTAETTVVPTEETGSPTEATTDEPTLEPSATTAPEETLEPEVTAELTETAIAPEETPEPEMTLEPEVTPEVTETPVPIEPVFEVTVTCGANGVQFIITNVGADMEAATAFVLTFDDEANAAAPAAPSDLPDNSFPIEFTLLAGENTPVNAGYGTPSLILEGVLYQPETPCLPPTPPVIEVSAVCTFDAGVTFTVTNIGGSMTTEQSYMISNLGDEQINSTFMLGSQESTSITAGYGHPVLTTGDVVSSPEETCFAPTSISGSIWDDKNEDTMQGGDESGIANVGLTLIDTSGTALYALTDTNGNYIFSNIAVGTYTINVDLTTLSSDYQVSFPESTTVNLQAYESNNPVSFGFTAHPTASVIGTVWMDASNYGVRDANETGVAGVLVELVDSNGTVVATAPVDAQTGTYVFVNLFSGDYTVRLAQATLFQPNAVSFNSDSTIDYETPITLTSGEALATIDFGLVGTY